MKTKKCMLPVDVLSEMLSELVLRHESVDVDIVSKVCEEMRLLPNHLLDSSMVHRLPQR